MTAEPARDILKFKRETSKRRLNKRAVASMKPPAEKPNGKTDQEWHYDTITARLAICVWSTGAKVWYWTGRIKTGDMIKLKLGTFPEVTPDQAKQLAGEISRDVTNGIDPREAKRKRRADLKLGELHEWYIENHAKPHKKPSSIKEDKRLYKSYLEPWKAKKISTIKRSDVRSLHAKIGRENGRYAANRMLSLLGTMFQKALDADDVDFSGENPARGVKRFAEESRERFLQADELQSFFEALNKLSPIMRDYFLLALLTGARRGNVQAMRWEELNLERGEWRVLDTKGGKPQTIYLSAEAVNVLRERQESAESEYVFPSRKGSKLPHITYQYRAWAELCKAAGVTGIRPHDLRRSLGSWQAATGASLPVIGKTLGHRNQSTTAIYARLNIDPVRESVDLATAAMLAAAMPKAESAE